MFAFSKALQTLPESWYVQHENTSLWVVSSYQSPPLWLVSQVIEEYVHEFLLYELFYLADFYAFCLWVLEHDPPGNAEVSVLRVPEYAHDCVQLVRFEYGEFVLCNQSVGEHIEQVLGL